MEAEDVQARIRRLENENRELRESNEILKSATAYFGKAEFDRIVHRGRLLQFRGESYRVKTP